MTRQAIVSGLAALGLAAGFALPASADSWETRIGLQCRADMVAIRTGGRWNDDPAYWHPLLPAYATIWANVPFSSDHSCTLASGDKVVMRSGQANSYATGAGAGDPPAFVSLWINGKKVLSREIYKAGYGASIRGPYVNSWFVSGAALERCAYAKGRSGIPLETRLDIECTSKSLDLAALAVDPLEPSPEITASSAFTYTATYNPDFCIRFIRKVSEVYPDAKGAYASSETLAPPREATFPFANDAVWNASGAHAEAKKVDFWNEGEEELVVRVWMTNSWLDSENYVFVNMRGATDADAAAQVEKGKAASFNRERRDFDLEPLKKDGWYAPTANVGSAVRMFRLDGSTFLLATATDNLGTQTGSVVRSGRYNEQYFGTGMETVCTFQQRKANN
jgi:hypothetical protein